MRKNIKRASVIGLALGLTTTAGVAFAAFTTSAVGNGAAAGGKVVAPTITISGPATLWPGHLEDVTVSVCNNNRVPVKLTEITGATVTPTEHMVYDIEALRTKLVGTAIAANVYSSYSGTYSPTCINVAVSNVIGLNQEATEQGVVYKLTVAADFEVVRGTEIPAKPVTAP